MFKQQKYGNKKTISHDGYSFSSQLEAAVYHMLKDTFIGCEIKTQDSVYLTKAKILYKPDFRVTVSEDSYEWYEAKGFETTDWRIKRRLWIHYGPGKLHIYKGSAKYPLLSETLNPEAV